MSRLTVTKDNVARTIAAMRGLGDKQTMVGIPSSTAERQPDPEDPQPLNNAAIGYLQEKGSPAANIPERPFLKPGVASVEDQIADRYKTGSKAVLDGRVASIDQVHDAVGIIAENAVKAKITSGPFAPLSDRTIAARKSRGRTGTKPLIDTGQLRNAVTHVIRPKG